MTMEGSSESDWQRPASSRGFNSSTLSDRNPRSLRANTLMLSGNNTSHDSGLKNLSDSYVLPQSSNYIKTSQISIGEVEFSDISLRQWLDDPGRTVDSIECLHIFTQIVEIVNLAHSQGIVVHNIRPSCFVMSSFNRVSFIESASCSDSGSDSLEEGSNSQTAEFKGLGQQEVSLNEAEDKKHVFPMKQILAMETNWYTSPEESSGGSSSCASDIYRLGVLLFELFCTFSSAEGKSATMSSLRHRLLPPQLLLKWPKEASFCLWLLHPEPSSRPKMDELLQSEFLNDPRDHLEDREVAIELKERIEDVELLLEFLLLMQQRKQEIADNLHKIISFISSDLEEVAKLQTIFMTKGGSNQDISPDLALVHPSMNITDTEDSGSSGSRKRVRPKIHDSMAYDDFENQDQKSETLAENEGGILHKNSRLMKNFKKLESAYFMTRRRSFKPIGKPLTRQSPISSDGRGSVLLTERSSVSNISTKEHYSENRPSGWINSFLEGLCKYHSFSTFKVKADLKQGDLLNSSNLVCSLGFDRDGEFFATAGVNKKIKVFEYESITNGGQDMHYPVVEMASRSKLSSICWNGYIKSQIASSNFEGVVQVWDVARGQVFTEMKEHERRVWSVDFSLADPTMLASGSDDGSVKLWNINQGVSVGTIQTEANVCCVQFPSDSGRFLAFGSADHKIYYYDLRNSKMPLCTLIGHNKTVSYIRFIDSMNLVSASTDNTLKLWDLSMCSSRVLDCPLQSFTGHVNVKNFVGLSVSDGYIATGSETNEVFVYHKAFPMPALSYKYISTDPISGDEVDAAAQFISSVCWRGQSSTLVAANSIGNIKVLEMV